MKKIVIDVRNAKSIAGIIKKCIRENNSIIFPTNVAEATTSKFTNLRRESSLNPYRLTTIDVEVTVLEKGIRIFNPFNFGFEYSDIILPFGAVTLAYNSFFWKDANGFFWRQMQFSKAPGWALKLTKGIKNPWTEADNRRRESIPGFDLIGTGKYCPDCGGLCGNDQHYRRW